MSAIYLCADLRSPLNETRSWNQSRKWKGAFVDGLSPGYVSVLHAEPTFAGSNLKRRYRSKVAEIHRQLMQLGPVGLAAADEWAVLTRKNFGISADDAAAHFARYCTPSNAGKWAYALVGKRAYRPGNYVKRRILDAFDQATWEQKVDAVYSAVGHDASTNVPDLVWAKGRFDPEVITAVADSVVKLYMSDLSAKRRDGLERSLQLLGLDGLSTALVRSWNKASSTLSKAEVDALLDFVSENSSEPRSNPSAALGDASKTSSDIPVAAILLRSRECRDVESYLSHFRQTSVSSDTLYLASALTYWPKWVVLFEDPVQLLVQDGRITVDTVFGTSDGRQIEVAFNPLNNSTSHKVARIPLGAAKRSYPANSVAHTAHVMLDLLFSRKEKLEASHATGDSVLANQRLSTINHKASSVYRLSELPHWDSDRRTSRLRLRVTNSNRKAHDVRGHVRIVDGVEYPVRPHRRES